MNHFIPWTPNYQTHFVEPNRTLGYNVAGRIEIGRGRPLPNRTFRYWPPRFPGQFVPHEFARKAALDNDDRVNMPDDPMPTNVDQYAPTPCLERPGYHWYQVTFPPIKVSLPGTQNVNGRLRNVVTPIGAGTISISEGVV